MSIQLWERLYSEAHKADMVRSSRHSAAIVLKGQIISIGHNKYKTHPIMLKYGKNDKSIYLHAEIDAIVKAINNHGVEVLKKCHLYVLRINKMGQIDKSCPCSGCQRAIEAFQIKKVCYT